MKIRESKNLRYTKIPKMTTTNEEMNIFEPRHCILESFKRTDDTFALHFKNGTEAIIVARNIKGGDEIDLIEERLPNFIDKSYEEILNTDFEEIHLA